MRIHHVVPSVANEARGPSQSVPGLCNALADRGLDVTLHVSGATSAPRPDWRFRFVEHAEAPVLRRLGFSPDLARALGDAARTSEILHNNSLWMMPNVYPATAVRGTKCRLVTSPRGVFSPWALSLSRWQKRVFWAAGQRAVIDGAACLHATAHSELADIRRLGIRKPVAVIPNGLDAPPRVARPPREGLRKLLFLGRVHPIKGVDYLLTAWRAVQESFPDWELDIVGPSEGDFGERMQKLAAELGVGRVNFRGPAYGAAKSHAYASADVFVLPTNSENFGVAVAEALAHGIPAIVSRGAPWDGLVTERCGWWVDVGAKPLEVALREALSLPRATLDAMGARGREWIEREFAWKRVAERMHATYEWTLGGGAPPAWVEVR